MFVVALCANCTYRRVSKIGRFNWFYMHNTCFTVIFKVDCLCFLSIRFSVWSRNTLEWKKDTRTLNIQGFRLIRTWYSQSINLMWTIKIGHSPTKLTLQSNIQCSQLLEVEGWFWYRRPKSLLRELSQGTIVPLGSCFSISATSPTGQK